MKWCLLGLLIVCVVAGCGPRKETVASAVMREPATVISLLYSPSYHDSHVSVGFSSSGNTVITPTSVDVPEMHGVVFECPHGRFSICGAGSRYKDLWSRMKPGQEAVVSYREVYEETYDDAGEK